MSDYDLDESDDDAFGDDNDGGGGEEDEDNTSDGMEKYISNGGRRNSDSHTGGGAAKLPVSVSTEGVLSLTIIRCTDLIAADLNSSSDPYVVIALCETGQTTRTRRTKTIMKTLNPEYGKGFDFVLSNPGTAKIVLNVYDEDLLGSDDYLGSTTIRVAEIIANESLRLDGPRKLEGVSNGEIIVKAVYRPLAAQELDTRNESPRRLSNLSNLSTLT